MDGFRNYLIGFLKINFSIFCELPVTEDNKNTRIVFLHIREQSEAEMVNWFKLDVNSYQLLVF